MTKLAETPMSVEEFLLWQDGQEQAHELVNGCIMPMEPQVRVHCEIIGNALVAIRRLHSRRASHVVSRFGVATPHGNVRFPDVMVDCGKTAPTDRVAAGPTVVIEVASPTSLAVDYLQKPRDYESVETITSYVILSQDTKRAAILRRSGDELLLEGEAIGAEAVIELPEIGVSLPLSEIYEGLDLKA